MVKIYKVDFMIKKIKKNIKIVTSKFLILLFFGMIFFDVAPSQVMPVLSSIVFPSILPVGEHSDQLSFFKFFRFLDFFSHATAGLGLLCCYQVLLNKYFPHSSLDNLFSVYILVALSPFLFNMARTVLLSRSLNFEYIIKHFSSFNKGLFIDSVTMVKEFLKNSLNGRDISPEKKIKFNVYLKF